MSIGSQQSDVWQNKMEFEMSEAFHRLGHASQMEDHICAIICESDAVLQMPYRQWEGSPWAYAIERENAIMMPDVPPGIDPQEFMEFEMEADEI